MKHRGVLVLLAGGVVATALALALAVRMPDMSRACPAMGYAYVGDVELVFSSPP
jgi:hypothetical protein